MTQADARRKGGGDEADDVVYVYGIVREGFDAAMAPGGIDDARVSATRAADVAALISRVPRGVYGAEAIEKNSGEVAWVSPRAMAHDRVLTWAHDHGGVVPLPMFSMWESEGSLGRWLGDRTAELTAVFDRIADADEFGLRVHRRDDIMMRSIDDLDADMAQLVKDAEAASPGQRYLLERKLAERGKSAVRAASQRLSKEIYQQLLTKSRDALALPLTPSGTGGATRVPEGTLVLNAAFLVDRRLNVDFRAAVAALARTHEPRGLVFDFTGPWPPYNFVGDTSREPRAAARAR